jgi:signal transduction histidine kinase/ActR/RegA family two-component response regulator
MDAGLNHLLRTLGATPDAVPDEATWQHVITGLTTLFHEREAERHLLMQLARQATTEFASREAALAHQVEQLHTLIAERTAALQLAQHGVEAATRAKNSFLANMSHEIRTPMTAILGYADLLLDPAQSASERSQCVHTIRRNSEHLLSVINDILDLSKIDDGRISIERSPVDVFRVVEELRSVMQVRAQDKSISLRTEVNTPFPAAVHTDPLRLQQILINLVSNAIKFTDSGGVYVRVSLVQVDERHLVRFEVIDTGVGMTAEQMTRLYQPFTQVDNSSTRAFGGTGLGLTISKRLAALMGGDIDVTSTVGIGTTFTLDIDAGDISRVQMLKDAPGSSFASRRAAAQAAGELQGKRILLAEDGPDNQRLFSHHLQRAGAELVVIDNGRLAVEKALDALQRGHPFDVVLMDMQMPELDGYGATSQLRSHGYRGPIIALTAHALLSDKDKCMTAGCSDYLTKPIERESLVKACVRWAAQAPSTEQQSSAA